jgi:hypothetical protein
MPQNWGKKTQILSQEYCQIVKEVFFFNVGYVTTDLAIHV